MGAQFNPAVAAHSGSGPRSVPARPAGTGPWPTTNRRRGEPLPRTADPGTTHRRPGRDTAWAPTPEPRPGPGEPARPGCSSTRTVPACPGAHSPRQRAPLRGFPGRGRRRDAGHAAASHTGDRCGRPNPRWSGSRGDAHREVAAGNRRTAPVADRVCSGTPRNHRRGTGTGCGVDRRVPAGAKQQGTPWSTRGFLVVLSQPDVRPKGFEPLTF